MIKLEFLKELIKLALYSGYIAGEGQSISLLICAEAESAKTRSLSRCVKMDRVLYLSDATAFEILKDYGDQIAEGEIRHLLIPDLIPMVSKRWETSASFIAFLNILIEEGIIESRTFALHKKFRKAVKCGIIACITPRELRDKRHKWIGTGFISRLLPVSWAYSEDTKVRIFDEIQDRIYRNELPFNFRLPDKDIEVELPKTLAQKVLPYTYQFAQAQQVYGFRYQKHLQRLLMASALANGRRRVNQEDLQKVVALARYLNLNFAAI